MARPKRKDLISPEVSSVVHCTHRCVRQAFLLSLLGDGEGHPDARKFWVEKHLSYLMKHFAVDCSNVAFLDNHVHLILRNRPDIVKAWTRAEIAFHWLCLYPGECPSWKKREKKKFGEDIWTFKPTFGEVLNLVKNSKKMAEIRLRLSDISWFMRSFAEPIARWINHLEGKTGRVWEGRFKMTLLLDGPAILACAIYVDLNTVHAGKHLAIEETEFTTAIYRLAEASKELAADATSAPDPALVAKLEDISDRYAFVAPLELKEGESLGSMPSATRRRTSDKGFLPVSKVAYVQLLQLTGEQFKPGKRGVITKPLEETLAALGIKMEHWLELAGGFESCFFSLAGSKEAIEREQKIRNLPSRKKCLGQKKQLCGEVPVGQSAG